MEKKKGGGREDGDRALAPLCRLQRAEDVEGGVQLVSCNSRKWGDPGYH